MIDQQTKRISVIAFRIAYIGPAVLLFLIIVADLANAYFTRDVPRCYSERIMGTEFRITISANSGNQSDAADKAFARGKELDRKLSDYRSDSELMRLCEKAGTGPVTVSDDLFAVMTEAQKISEVSDGAFDVTVGPVVRLWRLARRLRELPDEKELKEAMTKVGYKLVTLDPEKKTIALSQSGMNLDLGGIAKGFAAEEMMTVLREAGFPRALVAAGGDIVVGDPPIGAEGWKVQIAKLEPGELPPALVLHNTAISTSGDAEQFVEIGGKRYAHIVNPATGLGLTDRFAVTVIAKNGTTADALATAAAVLGPERGLKLVQSFPEASARFVWKTGDKIEERKSNGFNK